MKRFAGLKDLINERFPSRKATKLQDDDKLVTLQVGKTVWEQSPRQMRVELWMSSLQRRGVGVAAAAKFEDMLLTPVSDEAVNDIEKDIARTFPNTKRFSAAAGQDALRRVLHAYAAYDPEVGYCQGMNFVAGLLLMYLPERHAFGGLVVLMHDRGLRKYYSTDMSLLQTHLWQLGRLIPPRLCAHLESHGVLPLLYAASWLMTCFSADFPASFSARVMDVILHGWMMDQALLKAAVAVLMRCENRLLQLTEMEECLQLIKTDVPSWDESSLHDMLTDAFSKPWTTQQLLLLNSTEGAESVSEACQRVQAANAAAAAVAAAAGGKEPLRLSVSASFSSGSREQRISNSSIGERRTSDGILGCRRASSFSAGGMIQVNGSFSSSSRQGSHTGNESIPVLSAPAGTCVTVCNPASSSSGGSCGAAVAPQLLVLPSPRRSASMRCASTRDAGRTSDEGIHHNLLGLGSPGADSKFNSTIALCSRSGVVINTSTPKASQGVEQGSFLIDLESPRSHHNSTTSTWATEAADDDAPGPAAAAVQPLPMSTLAAKASTGSASSRPATAAEWDPFGPNCLHPASISTHSQGSFTAVGRSSNPSISTPVKSPTEGLVTQGSSGGAASTSAVIVNGPAWSPFQAAQQAHQPLSPQHTSPATVRELRQQLEQLSFSQLSQQQGPRFEQQGARLELLEQLSRQQEVLQRHYSLSRSFSLSSQLSPTSKLSQLQQQQPQASGFSGAALERLRTDDWSDFQSSPLKR